MFKRIFSFFIFSLFLLIPNIVKADNGWIIDNFQSNINILSTGKVEVTEVIDANFAIQKHGIYRDIPYIYYNESNSPIYSEINIESVTQNNQSAIYKQYTSGNFLRLQIGDPNQTFSGKAIYQVKYLVSGVLRSFSDHDELYWDVTGNGWGIPITKASAAITLPTNGITAITCYEGVMNSKQKCNSQITSQTQADFETSQSLNVNEGLTIVVGYTKGLVPILTISKPQQNFSVSYSTSSSIAGFFPDLKASFVITLVGLALVIWLWWKKGRDLTDGLETIVVEYFPPNNLRPAEVGTILDERADTLDVTATIIDLAARGFLTIKEEPKKWIFGSIDYTLSKLTKDQSNLLPFEKELMARIFDEDVKKMSELERQFYDDLVKVKDKLYQDVVDKKFFPDKPESMKDKYLLLAISIIVIGAFIFGFSVKEYSNILGGTGLGIIFTGVILLLLSRTFSKRTELGHSTYRKILGFKMFVEKAEKYKQQFLERQNIFSEILPYAIVFGVTEKWAKAFATLGIKPSQPVWYYSPNPFNPVLFTSNISSFSNSLSSAIASTPVRNSFVSSGSGFSGGGFSGGGFGGGGGGSW